MEKILRRLLEKILRGRVRLRKLPDDVGGGKIYMSDAGGLGALLKPMSKQDPMLINAAKFMVKPGNVVWDIGGNLGLFSTVASYMASSKGVVYTFEPDVEIVKLLRKTARVQSPQNAPMNIIPSAVANKTGLREFHLAARARASNSLADYGNTQQGGVLETQTVVALSLDDCLQWLPKPDVVKIDVEGAEHEILFDGATLLSTARPIILCEVSIGNEETIGDAFTSNDYVMFDAEEEYKMDNKIKKAAWNTLGIPKEKLADYLP